MRDVHSVILGPHMTEKVSAMMEKGSIACFRVRTDANKIEIRQAVEQIFKVKVEGVRTQRHDGKVKRLGRFAGRRPSWKKAVVTLAKGQSIPELS